jgi:DNA polymerase III alpha subunit
VRAIADSAPLPLFTSLEETAEDAVVLPPMTLGEEIVADYTALRLTLRAHPMALLRPRLEAMRHAPSRQGREDRPKHAGQ